MSVTCRHFDVPKQNSLQFASALNPIGARSRKTDTPAGRDPRQPAPGRVVQDDLAGAVAFQEAKPWHWAAGAAPIRFAGQTHDDVSLATLCRAVEVFSLQSPAEAQEHRATEAQASGSPVAVFWWPRQAGVVTHGVAGSLNEPNDTADAACRMSWVLQPTYCRGGTRIAALERAAAIWCHSETVVPRYIDWYGQTIACQGRVAT